MDPVEDPGTEWYSIVKGGRLLQGDILLDCPIINVLRLYREDQLQDEQVLEVDETKRHLVVLSQSCDLEQRRLENVLLAEVVIYDAYHNERNGEGAGKDFRKRLVRGGTLEKSLLRPHSGPPELGWSFADFRFLHVIPLTYLEEFAGACGDRLRLEPPYREHLSQAFARYFMRVGLPHDAADFEEYSPAKPEKVVSKPQKMERVAREAPDQ